MKQHFMPWSKHCMESWEECWVPLVVEKKKERPKPFAGILAVMYSPICKPEWDILQTQILSHDLSPRWVHKLWLISSAPVFKGGSHHKVFVNRGLCGDAELVNTCGMSGRAITQRGAASKENTAFTALFVLCNMMKWWSEGAETAWCGSLQTSFKTEN